MAVEGFQKSKQEIAEESKVPEGPGLKLTDATFHWPKLDTRPAWSQRRQGLEILLAKGVDTGSQSFTGAIDVINLPQRAAMKTVNRLF